MANVVIAYFAWVLGGLFGLQHFYLRRVKHAFVHTLFLHKLSSIEMCWLLIIVKRLPILPAQGPDGPLLLKSLRKTPNK